MMFNKEFVYFVSDGNGIKIGCSTRDIETRVSELQTGNSRAIKVIGLIPCEKNEAYAKEQFLHKKFEQFRLFSGGTEWFEDVPQIHAEYKNSLFSNSLFVLFENYLRNIRELSFGKDAFIYK